MWRVIPVAILSVLAVVGCSANPEPVATPTTTAAAPASPRASSPLVGEWQRVNRCAELVQVLTKAGLKKSASEMVVGSELVPGVRDPIQLADKSKPCKKAVPRIHSHFFTEAGQFGSRNHLGEQVDDGSYRIVDNKTVVISGGDRADVTFHYEITDDTLKLNPVLPECTSQGCFEAGWSLSVAYPGYSWERIS